VDRKDDEMYEKKAMAESRAQTPDNWTERIGERMQEIQNEEKQKSKKRSRSVEERIEMRKRNQEHREQFNKLMDEMDDEENTMKKIKVDDKNWPRFFILESRLSEGDTLDRLSPFAVSKYLKHRVGDVVSVKKQRSGSLLIEAATVKQAQKLQTITYFGEIPIKSSIHKSLNTKKGIIRCSDFKGMTDETLQKELAQEGVTEVKRIQSFRNNKKEDTNTFIITFQTPTLPKHITAGYLRLSVSIYIPSPLRCFNCQRYGHHKDKCRSVMACQVCSEEGHNSKDCQKDPLCRNCKGSHSPGSKQCPSWLKEKEIVKVKTEQNISFPDARRLCEQKNAAGPVTYAQATVPAVSKSTAPKRTSSISTQTDITWPRDQLNYQTIVQAEIEPREISTQTEPSTSVETPKVTPVTEPSTSVETPKVAPVKETQQQPKSSTEELSKLTVKLNRSSSNSRKPREKPGPASSKAASGSSKQNEQSRGQSSSSYTTQRSRKEERKTRKAKKPENKFHKEIELSNRFSELDGESEGEENMDVITYESSPETAKEVTAEI
jgi:hypothetical protein